MAIAITLEFTPNPNTLKFVINQKLMERGAANFPEVSKATPSPLAQEIFKVQGIQGVMLGTNFVTVTKAPSGDWDTIADDVPKAIEQHLSQSKPIFVDGFDPNASDAPVGSQSDVEKKIREILDDEIRPAVAMDGGDIQFGKFENGVVYLHLQGACSSCPSSIATLKMGVEARLKEVVPQVKEVVQY